MRPAARIIFALVCAIHDTAIISRHTSIHIQYFPHFFCHLLPWFTTSQTWFLYKMVPENKFAPCEENSFKKGENLTFLSVKRARKDYFKSFSYSKLPSNISTMSSIFFECKEVSLPPHIFIGKVRFTAYSISCKNDYLPNIWRIFGVNRFLDIWRFFRILTYLLFNSYLNYLFHS